MDKNVNVKGINVFIPVIIILALFILIKSPSIRKKTDLETNHLQCLAGITGNDVRKYSSENFGLINIYLKWKEYMPYRTTDIIGYKEQLLMITWQPFFSSNNEKSILKDITDGKYDDYIRDFALMAKNLNKPVLLRFAQEMNGNWFPWSGSKNGNNTEIYQKAYRYVYELFSEMECNNVEFVFSVSFKDIPNKEWNRFEKYYPGDEYVDWIGIDMINWGNIRKIYTNNPSGIINSVYERIIKKYPKKPILISEAAFPSQNVDKKKWIKEFFDSLKTKYTAIKAFVWYDIDKGADFSISKDKNLFDYFKKLIDGKYFTWDPESVAWRLGSEESE